MSRPTVTLLPGALQHQLDVRGWSRAKLAALVGVSRQAVTDLATGRTPGATCWTALRTLIVLDVRPSELLVMPDTAPAESRDITPESDGSSADPD